MSDLLIKDMELPKTCKYCYLSELDPMRCEYVCQPTGTRIDLFLAKDCRIESICPLVLIPPHGRLIDADALVKEVEDIAKEFPSDSIGAERFKLFAEFITEMPTIIPAEEGE